MKETKNKKRLDWKMPTPICPKCGKQEKGLELFETKKGLMCKECMIR